MAGALMRFVPKGIAGLVQKSMALWRPADWQGWVQSSGSGAPTFVSDLTMMRLTAAWSSVRLISESLSTLPLHLYQQTDDVPRKVKRGEHPLVDILKRRPSKYTTPSKLKGNVGFSLAVWNQAYILNEGAGSRARLVCLPKTAVTPELYNNNRDVRYNVLIDGRNETFELGEIIPIDGFGWPNGIEGMQVAGMHRAALALGMAAENYAARFFANGGRPSGVLTIDHVLNAKQREALREKYKNLIIPSTESIGEIPILEADMKYQEISSGPGDSQMIETRKQQVIECCRIWRIPPHMLYEMDKVSYNSAEQNNMEFKTYTLAPYTTRIEEALNAFLLSERDQNQGYFIRFGFEGLLRSDSLSRARFYREMRAAGIMTANQVRALEEWERIDTPAADDIQMPLNMAPSSIVEDVLLGDKQAANDGAG